MPLELPELAAAGTVMLFASFRTELDTMPIAEWVLRAGKRLCLPRVLGPRRMAAYRVTDLAADLAPGKWDIPEPRERTPEVPPEAIDLVFVPGLGVRRGGPPLRLRRRLLRHLPAAHAARDAVGRARLRGPVGAGIGCEDARPAVTAIVTERRVIRPG